MRKLDGGTVRISSKRDKLVIGLKSEVGDVTFLELTPALARQLYEALSVLCHVELGLWKEEGPERYAEEPECL